MGKKKKTTSRISRVAGVLARKTPAGKILGLATSMAGLREQEKQEKKRRRKMTVASIKKKIALLKAKKELAKIRGY